MAKNGAPGGGRRGAIRGRTQFRLPNGHYAKRDRWTGEILAVKADLKPFKNVVKEKENDQFLAMQTVEEGVGQEMIPAGIVPLFPETENERHAA